MSGVIGRVGWLAVPLVHWLPAADAPPDVQARVTRVVDGDTIWVELTSEAYKIGYITDVGYSLSSAMRLTMTSADTLRRGASQEAI